MKKYKLITLISLMIALNGCSSEQGEIEKNSTGSEIEVHSVQNDDNLSSPSSVNTDSLHSPSGVKETTKNDVESEDRDGESKQPVMLNLDYYDGYVCNFVNGIALVGCVSSKNGYYVIDMEGNVLSSIDDGEYKGYHTVRCNGDTFFRNNTLYDKYGNIIISPEKNGFDSCAYVTEDYIFVLKTDESFNGDTHYLGILDINGQWILPLSAIADDIMFPLEFYDVGDNCVAIKEEQSDTWRSSYHYMI